MHPLTDLAAQRFTIVGEPLAFITLRKFDICVEDEKGKMHSCEISFEEFSANHPDCDKLYVTCFQWDSEGVEDEKQLYYVDFIENVFYSPTEPYFTDIQKADYKEQVIETLLNIIEKR
jgi:hypothetical protein